MLSQLQTYHFIKYYFLLLNLKHFVSIKKANCKNSNQYRIISTLSSYQIHLQIYWFDKYHSLNDVLVLLWNRQQSFLHKRCDWLVLPIINLKDSRFDQRDLHKDPYVFIDIYILLGYQSHTRGSVVRDPSFLAFESTATAMTNKV